MKKFLKVSAVVFIVLISLMSFAFAAEFTHCADALNEIGLFKGTDSGYELDRSANRAEAGVMLVRLLGGESEALSLKYTAPFVDVPDWAKPYVQFLYNKGLTKGKSETSFGYSDKCTAQQYATFLLRALGYSDTADGDFSYADAIAFAKEKGVFDSANYNGESFLRDHVAATSYTALSVAPKSGEKDLLTKLVASGAIKDAKGYDVMFEIFREFKDVGGPTEGKNSFNIESSYERIFDGADVGKGVSYIEVAFDDNGEDSEMYYTLNSLRTNPLESAVYMVNEKNYYRDGFLYVDNGKDKFKLPMTFEEALAELDIGDTDETYISQLKKISKSEEAGGEVAYTIEFPSYIAESVDSSGSGKVIQEEVLITSIIKYKNGQYIYSETQNVSEGEYEGYEYKITSVSKMTDIKKGSGVTITVPENLDEYKE